MSEDKVTEAERRLSGVCVTCGDVTLHNAPALANPGNNWDRPDDAKKYCVYCYMDTIPSLGPGDKYQELDPEDFWD